MPFLSSKKNLFLFSDKKSSEILPENIAEKFDVITVSSDLKLLENFETFFESLEETAVFFDYSFIKYEILENKFFKWLNKTFVPVILLVYRNDLQIMFEKNVNLSKFIVLPEEQTQNLYSNSEEYDEENQIKKVAFSNANILSTFFPRELKNFIGHSPEIYSLKQKMLKLAPSDLSVLILGENGTGKTHLANMIHNLSPRKSRPFFSVNMAEIPETLGELYLFGSVEGCYTGSKNLKGYFEAANGGTIFLDEIGELSLSLQSKLLRVIETGKYRPVGAVSEKECDVRIICATNKNLKELMDNGLFREDLYYRIADFELYLEPLRNRREDIVLFTESFLKNSGKVLDTAALTKIQKYSWPGNVRQLFKCLNRAKLLSKDEEITEEEIVF